MVASDSSPVVSQSASNINERGALKGSARGAGKEERRETLSLLFSSFPSLFRALLGHTCDQLEKTGDESVVALYLKPRETPGRNIVGQQLPTLLGVVASVCM